MMGSVKLKLKSTPLSSQMNAFIFCAVLFSFVALSQSQAVDPETYIFKEKEEKVTTQIIVPEFPDGVVLIRVSKSSNVQEPTLIIIYSSMSIRVSDDYRDITKTTVDKPQKKVSIEFDVMKLNYAGTYKCYETTTENVVDNCGFKMIVLAKPSKPTVKEIGVSSPLVGETVVLECGFDSNTMPADHGLNPFIMWRDGEGNEITSSSQRFSVAENGNLVVPDIVRSDLGMSFVCRTADDPGTAEEKIFSEDSTKFDIIPEYPPSDSDFIMTPEFENNTEIQKTEKTELQYKCHVDCKPECDVSWQKMPYGATKYVSIVRSKDPKVLSLDAVSRRDQGSFICQGSNKHGRNHKGFNLEVLYILTPEVIVSGTRSFRKSVFENDNDEVNLTCHVDSNPRPTVTWRDPSNWLINQSRFSGPEVQLANKTQLIHRYTSNVTLRHLTCEDGGNYKCVAENDLRMAVSGEINIDVRCQPSAVDSTQHKGLDDSLILQDEYVWELGRSLKGKFVIRGLPTPTVTRVESTLDGETREESVPGDITIGSQHPYLEKVYLTLFNFQVERPLTLADRGRVYKLIMENSDFESKFKFTIRPRGPPLQVSALNTTDISHNAVTLSWKPEFNGGEPQTFSIYMRKRKQKQTNYAEDTDWDLVMSDIQDRDHDMEGKVNVKVKSLSAQTIYEIMVMSVNQRGNASTSIFFVTAASPSSSANVGGIVGGVIAVIVILVIIGLVLFYFLVYKKRWGKGSDGESRIPMLGRMSKIFRGKKNDPNGNVGVESKKSRPIFTGKSKTPKPKEKDYSNVPTESVDPTDAIEYSTPIKKRVDPLNGSMSQPDDPVDGKGDGRVVTDDGLTYVTVDFRNAPPRKPKRLESLNMETVDTQPKDTGGNGRGEDGGEGCPYSSIDFEKTRAKEEEIKRLEEEEAARRRDEEERKRKQEEEGEEEEEYYENLPSYGTTV